MRGTKLDIFGYDHIRKMERTLVAEHREIIELLLRTLELTKVSAAMEIASRPDMVRGYEQIKVDNVAAYHERPQELLAVYAGKAAAVPAAS